MKMETINLKFKALREKLVSLKNLDLVVNGKMAELENQRMLTINEIALHSFIGRIDCVDIGISLSSGKSDVASDQLDEAEDATMALKRLMKEDEALKIKLKVFGEQATQMQVESKELGREFDELSDAVKKNMLEVE